MRLRRIGVMLLAAVAASSVNIAVASADGDPASDVLLGENVFYPYNPPVSQSIQNKLNAETAAAANSHFPIKVAIIGAPIDLGVIPDLFGKPQQYADFLDQEISFQTKQPLLVVMAAGYGVRGLPSQATAMAASLPKPASGVSNDLAEAALAAVPKLAAAAGHPIVQKAGGGGGSGGGSKTVIVVILGLAALATAGALIAVRLRQAAAR